MLQQTFNFEKPRTDKSASPARRNIVIEAGAGTGKTTAIVAEVLKIMLENEELSPERIVLVTFTEKAAGEIADRIHAALASLRHEERRLERLGLETPLARCRAQRRYWEFLPALFSSAGQDSVAGRPDGDDSWRGVGQE